MVSDAITEKKKFSHSIFIYSLQIFCIRWLSATLSILLERLPLNIVLFSFIIFSTNGKKWRAKYSYILVYILQAQITPVKMIVSICKQTCACICVYVWRYVACCLWYLLRAWMLKNNMDGTRLTEYTECTIVCVFKRWTTMWWICPERNNLMLDTRAANYIAYTR